MRREPPTRPGLSVLVLNRQRGHRLRVDDLKNLLERAAAILEVSGDLAVVFAGDVLLRRLNRDYRAKDKPTDVLSFEGSGGDMGLGDVIISVPAARRNARALSRSLDRELEVLALHGFLHVLGYDHETDSGEMEALEKRLRARLLRREGRAAA
jgi:probable rRNA maturation factor